MAGGWCAAPPDGRYPDTAGRRHTDLQCVHEIFIGGVGFLIAGCQCSFLRLETLSLVDGVILTPE